MASLLMRSVASRLDTLPPSPPPLRRDRQFPVHVHSTTIWIVSKSFSYSMNESMTKSIDRSINQSVSQLVCTYLLHTTCEHPWGEGWQHVDSNTASTGANAASHKSVQVHTTLDNLRHPHPQPGDSTAPLQPCFSTQRIRGPLASMLISNAGLLLMHVESLTPLFHAAPE